MNRKSLIDKFRSSKMGESIWLMYSMDDILSFLSREHDIHIEAEGEKIVNLMLKNIPMRLLEEMVFWPGRDTQETSQKPSEGSKRNK